MSIESPDLAIGLDPHAQTGSVPVSGYALKPEEIREFQALIAQETGVQLSTQDAWDRAIELISLVRMLVSPLPEDPES